MILRRASRKLHRFYDESVKLQKKVEGTGKDYREDKEAKNAHNLEFYENVAGLPRKGRLAHFPKIAKDRVMLRKMRREFNEKRRNLAVIENLRKAGVEEWVIKRLMSPRQVY